MTPTQLHELDVSIAKAMGKERLLPDMFRDCFLTHKENGGVGYFQPTRNPAAAMEVLEWVVRDWFGTVSVGTTADGDYFICGEDGSVESKTLPLTICLFAEKIINTNPSK